MAKIYLIYNKKNNKKYVGETLGCVSQRFCQHIDSAFRTYKERKNIFYKEILESGEKVFEVFCYKILEECKDDERFIKEIEYISKIKPEYNENFKKYYLITKSKDIIEKYNSGMTVTQIRQFYHCRHDFIVGILKSHNIEIQKSRNKFSKKVYMFDENGKYCKSWNDAGCCSRELNIDRGNIRACCLKNTKSNILYFSANGFHFKYNKETPKDMYIVINEKNEELRFKTKEALINYFKQKFPNKNILYGQLVRDRKTVFKHKIKKTYNF